MTVKIVSSDTDGLVLEINIPLGAVRLDGEERIEQALNEAGSVVSGELLKRFDTDGSAIQVGDTKLTSKGQMEKTYKPPTEKPGSTATSIKPRRAVPRTAHWNTTPESFRTRRQNWRRCCRTNTPN